MSALDVHDDQASVATVFVLPDPWIRAGDAENEGPPDFSQRDQLQHGRLLKCRMSLGSGRLNLRGPFAPCDVQIMDAAVRAGRPEEAWSRQQAAACELTLRISLPVAL